MSYIEISDKGSEENPVQIVFDLGENPHEYNSIGLIPRLQWVGNSPKYLKIEVSDEVLTRSEDITNWILVGSAKRDAFTKTELDAHDGGNWNDCVKICIIGIYDFLCGIHGIVHTASMKYLSLKNNGI